MSTEIPPVVERRVIEQPTIVRREVVGSNSSNTGWWIATLVAVVAVMALIFVFTSQPNDALLESAAEQGRNQAMIENAATQAQSAADAANLATANAAASVATANQSAAEAGRVSAERRALAAEEAAMAAKARIEADPPEQVPN